MTYRYEKTDGGGEDLVISGGEMGVQPSPHKGIANIQNANISTEVGEVMASFGRTQQSMTASAATGTLGFIDGSHVALNIPSTNNNFKGMWITVSSSSHTGELANGTYYVQLSIGSNFTLSATFSGSTITGYTAGLTATIVLLRTMGQGIQSAVETYFNTSSTYYRYYILDNQGLVWVYDSINDLFPSDNQQYWFLPDNSVTYFSSDTAPSGIAILNGWLLVFSGNKIWAKPTVKLSTYVQMTNAILTDLANSGNPHFAMTGHQGKCYYCDGTYLGEIFPDTSILSGVANIQSYASYTTSTTTGTPSIIAGSIASTGANVGVTGFSRIPAVFFAATGGTPPTALTANTVFYIEHSTANGTFQVFAALTGGSALDITTGASGTQYYNTFWVIGTHAGAYGDTPLMTFTPERLNLPIFETAKCMVELGNSVIIGCTGNILYPWNQIDTTPSDLISLPEINTSTLINVNNMAYAFVGNRGNIYITNGSVASLVIKVSDYCAGIAGTSNSYVEPYFVWGGAMYCRGRVYFSILDQTLFVQSSVQAKAGNCGGIWSFIPTQNMYIGQDVGQALRLENQNSYATYNGAATVLISSNTQNARGPQYWAAWFSSLVSPTYGIDFTAATPTSAWVVETDLVPTGTMLNKSTDAQIEYKLAAPLQAGETITIEYRLNSTDAYQSCGISNVESTTDLAGYFTANFQNEQWVQFRITGTPIQSSSSSFVRFTELRIR